MQIRSGLALVGALLLGTACAQAGGEMDVSDAALETNAQKASYGIGLNVGRQLEQTKSRLDRAAFLRGMEDFFAGVDPAVERDDLQAALTVFQADVEAAAQADFERESAEHAEAGAAYLAENGAKEGVTITESGLQYEVLRQGDGALPGPDDTARLHYRGTLIDGTEFDASYGGDPAEFAVGGLIDGFTEALLLMPVGSHYRIVIPSGLAYGPPGRGSIPPNATLVFEVELLEIVGG